MKLDKLREFIAAAGTKVPVAVIDTETTGFSPDNDCIVQFSGVKGFLNPDGTFDTRDAEVIDFYIRSLIPMPEDASRVNGITDELLLEKGVERTDAEKRILDFIRGSAIVGHNIPYDLKMIAGFFRQQGREVNVDMTSPLICDTLALAREVVYDPAVKHPCALGNLIKRIDPEGRYAFHNSIGDVYATVTVYNWLVAKI
ncbi:MAG: PolC-type DNA polymerase III [Candidatus Weimeria sp.]